MPKEEASSLSIISYNIHKGFSPLGRVYTARLIKKMLRLVRPDIVMLQEIVGDPRNGTQTSQYEYLADQLWPEFAYGKNAHSGGKHHGNCILSKYPITSWNNLDISTNKLERRGLLHAKIKVPNSPQHTTIELLNTHLNLLQKSRTKQLSEIAKYIRKNTNHDSPLILGGDFNDWQQVATQLLKDKCGLNESFLKISGKHEKTFPSILPLFKLDRIYYKNLSLISAEALNNFETLSDHIPLYAKYKL